MRFLQSQKVHYWHEIWNLKALWYFDSKIYNKSGWNFATDHHKNFFHWLTSYIFWKIFFSSLLLLIKMSTERMFLFQFFPVQEVVLWYFTFFSIFFLVKNACRIFKLKLCLLKLLVICHVVVLLLTFENSNQIKLLQIASDWLFG